MAFGMATTLETDIPRILRALQTKYFGGSSLVRAMIRLP
jgi:hypothetical protein